MFGSIGVDVNIIYSWPILDTMRKKMNNSELVNVGNPIPKDYLGLVSTHPVN